MTDIRKYILNKKYTVMLGFRCVKITDLLYQKINDKL